MRWAWLPIVTAALAVAACSDDDGGGPPPAWKVVHSELDRGLTAVWGSSEDDVWAVGGADVPDDEDGTCGGQPCNGPIVLHWDGSAWDTVDTDSPTDLWWIFGVEGGPVYAGGAGGRILEYEDGSFAAMQTPVATPVVFGIWGCSADDVWAVGGNLGGGSGGFAWHLEGGEWVDHPVPDDEGRVVWKVIGKSCDDVRFIGEEGLSFSWDGSGFTPEATGIGESLFTVAVEGDCYYAVGGVSGIILEDCGGGWEDVSPDGAPGFNGVCARDGEVFATGQFGTVYRRDEDGTWVADEMPPTSEGLHSCWIDPSGGLWAVGGQVLAAPLIRGVMVYRGGLDFAGSGP